LGARGNDNVGADLSEGQCDGRAEAAPATGDDSDVVVESEFVQDHGRHRNKAAAVPEPDF
jgi:hypothetical protein